MEFFSSGKKRTALDEDEEHPGKLCFQILKLFVCVFKCIYAMSEFPKLKKSKMLLVEKGCYLDFYAGL